VGDEGEAAARGDVGQGLVETVGGRDLDSCLHADGDDVVDLAELAAPLVQLHAIEHHQPLGVQLTGGCQGIVVRDGQEVVAGPSVHVHGLLRAKAPVGVRGMGMQIALEERAGFTERVLHVAPLCGSI